MRHLFIYSYYEKYFIPNIQQHGQSDSLPSFDKCPELVVDLDIAQATVSKRPGNSKMLQKSEGQTQKQLHHDCQSMELTANASEKQLHDGQSGCQMTILLGCLPCFDGWPSHCSVAIGEVLRSVAKGEAQEAYGIDQLCAAEKLVFIASINCRMGIPSHSCP